MKFEGNFAEYIKSEWAFRLGRVGSGGDERGGRGRGM